MKYKAYRNALNRIIKTAKIKYYQNFLTRNKNNAKKIWEAINDLTNTKTKTSVPNKLQKENGDIVTDSDEIAEEFNNFFVNIGSSMAKSIPPVNRGFTQRTNHAGLANSFFFFEPSTPYEVNEIIRALNDQKAKRKLDSETKFMKYANPVISVYLSHLFNLCITTGVFPDSLKIAEVIPIFKKGNTDKPTNYRPIFLLSQFNKIFEKLIYNRIYSYLEKFYHSAINSLDLDKIHQQSMQLALFMTN